LEFEFDLQNPLKQPKMLIFEKWKIIVFGHNYGIFWPTGDLKPCIIMYLGNIYNRWGHPDRSPPFAVGNKYESLSTIRRISTSFPASQPQPYQCAGVRKIRERP